MSDNEKRVYKRLDNRLQVKYETIESNSAIPLTTYTRNISTGGFLFRSSSPVKLGSSLKLKFFLEDASEFISSEAKVVRVEEIVDNKIYDIGIEFINISEKDVEKLTKYLTNKL